MKSDSKTADRFRIAVLGHSNVGKSALTVRYLTRRYIGEYHSNSDLLYRQTVNVQNSQLDVEIMDVSGETRDSEFPVELVQWAEVCILVYAVDDRRSFETARRLLQRLSRQRTAAAPNNEKPVFALIGNKADLEHLRTVSSCEGRRSALEHGCFFAELSVAENCAEVTNAFETLLLQCRRRATQSCVPTAAPACALDNNNSSENNNNNNKGFTIRRFSVSKMLNSLIGAKLGGGATVNNNGAGQQSGGGGGTVVVCQPADLYKHKVTSRRPPSYAAL